MPRRSLVVVLECAGHRRAELRPATPGLQWQEGAVSEARWTGTPLAGLLRAAGIDREAAEVVLTGADRGAFERQPGRHPYARALPLAKALHKDTMLAYEMNGEPIPPEHGGPVRAIVPGWYATDSVKWVERVAVVQAEFDGPFQALDYRFATADDPGPGARMERMPVHALITAPGDGLAPGRRAGRGAAAPPGAERARSRASRCASTTAAGARRAVDRAHRPLRPHPVGVRLGRRARAAHDRRARPRRQRRGATLRAGLEPARLCQQLRPPGHGDGRGGDLMATFDRNAALANETVAADAELDAWLAQRDLGREWARAELSELVRELAARPDLWQRARPPLAGRAPVRAAAPG